MNAKQSTEDGLQAGAVHIHDREKDQWQEQPMARQNHRSVADQRRNAAMPSQQTANLQADLMICRAIAYRQMQQE